MQTKPTCYTSCLTYWANYPPVNWPMELVASAAGLIPCKCPMGSNEVKNLKNGFPLISCARIVSNSFKKVSRVPKKLLNTIWAHLDTAGQTSKILHYVCFWECQCTRNDPRHLPFCPATPQNTFIFLRCSIKIFLHHYFKKQSE